MRLPEAAVSKREDVRQAVGLARHMALIRRRTVNGAVRAQFVENPRGASSFETVNGDVEVALRRGLGADLRLRTMNGEIFSDYDYRPLPAAAVTQRRENGRFVYDVDHATAIRIGAGGPRLELETLNGDLLIRNQDGQSK